MFRKMAEEKEFCEEILRTILDDKDLVVVKSTPQWTGTNLMGRSVILDAKCVTGDGRWSAVPTLSSFLRNLPIVDIFHIGGL